MAAIGAQKFYPRGVADDERGCDAAEQCGEIGIGEPVVQRHVGNAGDGRAEQCDRCRLAAFLEQRDMGAAAFGDRAGGALGRREKLAIGPAPAIADQTYPVRVRIGGHLQNERYIHVGSVG